MINIIVWVLATVVTGICYRMGGAGEPYKSWMRDYPCALINTLLLFYLSWSYFSWWVVLAMVLTFGLNIGAYSSYWGEKTYYSLHALGLSIACLPYTIYSGHWWGFVIRTVVLVPAIILWSKFNDQVVKEEIGRGAIITGTLPLLLI